jgi:hypothetical protein
MFIMIQALMATMGCYISQSFESFQVFDIVFGKMETNPKEYDETKGNEEGQPSGKAS